MRQEISAARGRSTRKFRRLREQVLSESDICVICGHAGANAGGHDIAKAVDPSLAEDEDNIQPVHNGRNACPVCHRNCNREQGTRPFAAVIKLNTSRDWFAA